MDSPKPSVLEAQVRRVKRRLFAQGLLNRVVVGWTAALALGLVWLLLEPLLIEAPAPWLRWTVVGALVALGTVGALVAAIMRRPSALASALSLDERFGLKERVTTSLALTPEQRQSPAGQALLEDVQQRVGGLVVRERFPIRLSWLASLVPLAAALLALVALFYDPALTPANVKKVDAKKPVANAQDIALKMDQMKKKFYDPADKDKPTSEKLKEFEAEMEKIANQPRATREEVRERMKDMTALEDRMREHQHKLMDKDQALKQQLQEMNRQSGKDNQDGPAKDMQKALAQGDMQKAKEEMEKLAKKVQDGKMGEQEKEQLKKQLESMKQKAEQLADQQKKQEERLEQLIKDAKAEGRDAEALKRELDKLKQDGKAMKELQDLAQKMGDCKQCLENGDMAKAGDKLKEMGDQLKNLNLNDKERKQLEEQLERLKDAKGACAKGDKDGEGDKGDGAGKGGEGGLDGKQDAGNGQPGEGRGSGDQPGGRRSFKKDADTKGFDARQKTDPDFNKGKFLDGFEKGPNFKAKSGPEIAGDIKQAGQEAPEAIEQQRIPKASRDIAKGFFRNLSGQGEPEKKP